ncbi:hypothetical protein NLJ89_g1508 [Agrocybe chaxingu]|uniref:Uncharacterized protein n=1 Tax=Agrocybe chaxingu TaxID=84603 RepID=A0A9W8MZX3_9AGAR|nr:hypothetical protein NLJ89_g1508 [Agrocybe chaxingu]
MKPLFVPFPLYIRTPASCGVPSSPRELLHPLQTLHPLFTKCANKLLKGHVGPAVGTSNGTSSSPSSIAIPRAASAVISTPKTAGSRRV